MLRLSCCLLALSFMCPAWALDAAPKLPSGAAAWLYELRAESGTAHRLLRLRYVVPEVASDAMDFEAVAGDFKHLCEMQALPYFKETQTSAAQIIISFSSQPVEFGVSQADVIQYFELFTAKSETCIWEAF